MAHDRKESYDRRNARNNPRRIQVGDIYVGMTHKPETAATLNAAIRKDRHARKQQSRA